VRAHVKRRIATRSVACDVELGRALLASLNQFWKSAPSPNVVVPHGDASVSFRTVVSHAQHSLLRAPSANRCADEASTTTGPLFVHQTDSHSQSCWQNEAPNRARVIAASHANDHKSIFLHRGAGARETVAQTVAQNGATTRIQQNKNTKSAVGE
jgi:hypothetical protein